jgi:hypothetical protein
MAWIESNQELGRHPKMKKLARLLSISWPEAVGYLHYLWWWALDYAQDGDLSKYEYGDIADAVLWQGDPEIFVNALIESGFLDKTEDGGLIIHDWFDYAGRLIEKRVANRERMRRARAKTKEECSPNVQNTNNARAGATEQNSTVPNSTVPNHTEPDTTPPDNEPLDSSPPVPYEKIRELFNTTCPSFEKVLGINGKRKIAVAARWKEHPDLDFFKEYFERVEASDFLKGKNDRKWKATFDWLMNAANMDKVREGKYDGDGGGKKRGADKEHSGKDAGNFSLSGGFKMATDES